MTLVLENKVYIVLRILRLVYRNIDTKEIFDDPQLNAENTFYEIIMGPNKVIISFIGIFQMYHESFEAIRARYSNVTRYGSSSEVYCGEFIEESFD